MALTNSWSAILDTDIRLILEATTEAESDGIHNPHRPHNSNSIGIAAEFVQLFSVANQWKRPHHMIHWQQLQREREGYRRLCDCDGEVIYGQTTFNNFGDVT